MMSNRIAKRLSCVRRYELHAIIVLEMTIIEDFLNVMSLIEMNPWTGVCCRTQSSRYRAARYSEGPLFQRSQRARASRC